MSSDNPPPSQDREREERASRREEPTKTAARPPRGIIFGVALFAAVVGPRIVGKRDRPADAPFAYVPPEGFVASDPSGSKPAAGEPMAHHPGTEPAQMWILPQAPGRYTPRVTLSHTDRKGPMDAVQVADIARGMPAVFLESGITWTLTKQEAHTRGDGALVGIIFGDAKRASDASSFRSLQMAFPDDKGTSIVTASYAALDGPTLEPAFMTSLDRATGVALRFPPTPSWMYGAFGLGGLFAAYIATALFAKKK